LIFIAWRVNLLQFLHVRWLFLRADASVVFISSFDFLIHAAPIHQETIII